MRRLDTEVRRGLLGGSREVDVKDGDEFIYTVASVDPTDLEEEA